MKRKKCVTAVVLVTVVTYLLLISHEQILHIVRRNPPHDSEHCVNDLKKHRDTVEIQNLVSRFTNSRDLEGVVWPKMGLLDDRIQKQLNFIQEYAKINKTCPSSPKVILRVGEFNFKHLGWQDGRLSLIKENCPITNCWLTSELSFLRYADALVISDMNKTVLTALTPKPRGQIWISQHQEAPIRNQFDPTPISRLVNWSASLRPESTLVIPYAHWIKVEEYSKKNQPIINYAEGKTKNVVWFVSNCKDKNGRMNYTKELSKFIDVDIFGQCGKPSPCPRMNYTCFQRVIKPYKFYLAFENSNCVGYITEKLHRNALTFRVVPIVMGARPEDYEAVAPSGSYIHVDNFDGPKELAQYLKVLDSDDNLYNKYFQYKEHYKYVSRGDTKYWCRVCALLHLKDDVNYVHWYDDYIKWWNGACYARKVGNQTWMTWKGTTAP